MDPMTIGLLLGAVTGALKGDSDQKTYQSQMKQAAETQRYSPWTGMKASMPTEPNPFGTMASFAGAGASLGQGVQNAGGGSPATSAGAMNADSLSKAGMSADPYSPNNGALGSYNYKQSPWALNYGLK